jgi:UPF0755 protein
MSVLRGIRVLLLFLFAVLAGVIGWLAWFASSPLTLPAPGVDFSISAGSSLRSATRQIVAAGIPMPERVFTLLARIAGKETQVKAGSYELTQGATPWALLKKITQGDYQLTEIAFIEGWTFAQMRAALDASDVLRHESTALSDAQIMERLGSGASPAEGYFFPDTYLFAKGESDLKILARAHRAMRRQLDAAWQARGESPLASPEQALTLASIVEKETGDARERALIAGVFANRLRLGMKLQTDPTVIYGMGKRFDGNLRRKDLSEDTPFNTYTREGLPPHPIANPGRAALAAAVNPARTDALYFVSRGDGTHQFSRSLDEHNRAVAKFQRSAGRQ